MTITDPPAFAPGRRFGDGPPRALMALQALDDIGYAELLGLNAFGHLDPEVHRDLLEEFQRFVDEVISPTDRIGHRQGVRFDPATGSVETPEGFAAAYASIVDAGWIGAPFPLGYGGGGLPKVIGVAMGEMLASANLSLSLCPALTQSAIELLGHWGTPDQRAAFLPRLITGEWTGTMLMTEPEAGSDVGAVRTTARPTGGDSFVLEGTKIYISWGEHDLTDNIIHFVLARTPGSPPGVRGLSLFIVPKYLVGPGGATGERNALRCIGLEDKMGLHASPTCVMQLDGAVGELIGEEGGGLRAMFTMMNAARLAIGLQGLAVGEAAYAEASAHAGERIQGRPVADHGDGEATIASHPDVRRMLALMRSDLDAMRLTVYLTAFHADVAAAHPEPARREEAQHLVELLTPVAKAWVTDLGVEVASLAIQVQGGMGYMEDGPGPQRLVDARIGPIYEGTNGIQAIDLVTRKLPLAGGAVVRSLLDRIADDASLISAGGEGGQRVGDSLAAGVASTRRAVDWLLNRIDGGPGGREDVLAGATPFLAMFGDLIGGWLLVRRALRAAEEAGPTGGSGGRASHSLAVAAFYADERLRSVPGREGAITAGSARLFC